MFHSLELFAEANAASDVLRSSISPLFSTMITVAAILCVLFIIFGGYYYMTSAGNPEKLARAKKTLRNAFIGFAIVLGSGGLVAIMQNAYSQKAAQPSPVTQVQVEDTKDDCPLCEVVNQSITGFVNSVIQSIGKPVVDLLKQFTTATPLMAQNGAVFNVWIVIVAIVDVLFILVVALIGFRVMNASVLGLEDVDLRSLVPQIILTFILANLSIFAIDAIITVSNATIQALLIGMSNDIVWVALGGLIAGAATINIGVLLFIAVAIILAVMLLVYYLQRMIVLYVGAVLSPLIVLLWLLPSFRDFAVAAAKTYIITIFVLFVHVVVLMLAVSLFSGLVQGEGNPFMTALLGIATLLVLLKTNRTMNQMAMLSAGNQGIRKLGGTFVRGVSHMTNSAKKNSQPGVSVTRTSGNTGLSASRVHTAPTTTILATRESRQVSQQKAADALTSKQKIPHEVVVASGTKRNVELTEKPTRKAPRTPKGAIK